MSFRRFIYYCTSCGGCAAYGGWLFSRLLPFDNVLALSVLQSLCLGLTVAFALGVVDGLWGLAVLARVNTIARASGAAAVGALGGALGGLLGYALLTGTHLEAMKLFGWLFTGIFVGTAPGLVDVAARLRANLPAWAALSRALNGALGGGVGGFLGGIVLLFLQFLCKRFVIEDTDTFWSPGTWGFVALGLAIGLFFALAQVHFREAWLRVESGRRRGREMLLLADVSTIGRSASCDICLIEDPEVEVLHARLVRREATFLIEDVQTPDGTFVNDEKITKPTALGDGDVIRVGKSVLRFGEKRKNDTALGKK